MNQDPDSQDPLDYGALLQDALRHLVRRSLGIVAEQGMPGDHHFYLSFRTTHPGVVMPPHLRDSYPEEMTIVLKTQFHDLVVDDDTFSVGLVFSGVRYGLTVPFALQGKECVDRTDRRQPANLHPSIRHLRPRKVAREIAFARSSGFPTLPVPALYGGGTNNLHEAPVQ